jgi:hypothetical protein
MNGFYTTHDEHNEIVNPDMSKQPSKVEEFKTKLDEYLSSNPDNDVSDNNIFEDELMSILKTASIVELHKIKKIFMSEKYNNDVCQDIEKLVEAIIENKEEDLEMGKTTIAEDVPDNRIGTGINRELKKIVDEANTQYRANLTTHEMKQIIHEFVIDLMELIEDKSREDLTNAYQFTLYPNKNFKNCPVKPGYDAASKILDDALEEKGISRDMCGTVYNTREFGTPYDPMRHRKTHTTSSHHRGGSYKKRRRPSLKKSRRVKRRKTKTMRKTRKRSK